MSSREIIQEPLEDAERIEITHQGMPLSIPLLKLPDRSRVRYEIGNPVERREHGIARRAQRQTSKEALDYFKDVSSWFLMGGIGAEVAAKKKGEIAYLAMRKQLEQERLQSD